MGRIKIGDLPKDQKITKEEMRKVLGGGIVVVGGMPRGIIEDNMPFPKASPKLFDVFR